ncbi:MAG: dTDP-glucose 4,6-dehydratase [Candidatus Diapherotrites archaeon]
MQSVLVTGGAGFIGSNFVRFLLKKYSKVKVVNLDKLTYAGNLDNLKGLEENKNYKFIKGDICDAKTVEKAMKGCDVVVNFAAESHVDRSIEDPASFLRTDVFGTYVLLEEARKQKVERFVQISTDEVYGSVEQGSSKETDALMPRNPYSASKAAADRLAYSFYATYELPVVITRSSNNYGPYQYPEKIIPLFITNLLRGKKVPLYGDGKNSRDWLYVEDNCEAIDLVLSKGKNGEAYNIGAGNEVENVKLTEMILEALGKGKESIEFVKDRLGHDRRYSLDCGKIEGLGWKPKAEFKKKLVETVEWYKQNKWWWNSPVEKKGAKK